MAAWNAWENGIKRSLLIWHRRAGKDELSLQKFAVAAHLRPANYWHCLPMYEQARKAIWEAVNPHTGRKRIDEAFPPEIRKRTDNSSMTIEFQTGAVYRVVGSDNPDTLVGAPPLGIAFSEWALSNPSSWGLLQPILLENGGWADFITTPRGKNHVHGMLAMARENKNWFAQVLTVDDTRQVSADDIEEARKGYVSLFGEDAAEALIQQEYWCSFDAAILGAYWGKELAAAQREGRIKALKPVKGYPLHTAWDLGIRDSNVIWFFQIAPDVHPIRVLGCYAATNYGIGHYAEIIKEFAARLELERGEDFVPHDARQREMGTWVDNPVDPRHGEAKQRIEVMIECGLHPRKVMDHALMDGISAVRQILPKCIIDEECCGNGVEGLRQYQTEWDDEKKIFSDRPLHNWASHFADGFRTLAMAYREVVVEAPRPKDRALVVGDTPVPGMNLPTFDDILKLQSDEPKERARF